jgi:hypothetical protein
VNINSTEEWRSVEGFPGYEVSNLGRVRSIDRVVIWKRRGGNFPVSLGGKILRPGLRRGYKEVTLCSGGERQRFLVHRLVVMAFIGPPPKGLTQVNHKDGDKQNNWAGNLEWVTPSENVQHAIDSGLWRIKYVFSCTLPDGSEIVSRGAGRMVEELRAKGYERVLRRGVCQAATRGCRHAGLTFTFRPFIS